MSPHTLESLPPETRSDPLIIFKPELSCWVYRSLFEVFDAGLGAAVLDEVLADFQLTRAQLLDREAWVSLEFNEAFLTAMANRGVDPASLDAAARLSLTPKHLGPLYAFLRAFGDVKSTYARVASSTPRFNKTGEFAVEFPSASRCRLTFRPKPATRRERTPYMCRFREVQLSTVPTLFDLTPARLDHPKCLLRGADCCVYDLSWDEPEPRRAHVAGASIGLAGGALTAAALHLPIGPLVVLCGLAALAGWALGKLRTARSEIAARVQDVVDQQDALARSMRANEARFDELVQAKVEVDQKVELRTKELRDTTQRLFATLQEIQALDRAKTDFFNNVSHELRSPLTLILAPLEDMLAGRAPAHGTTESMHRNATRLLHLINQLLKLAKIDAGEARISPVSTDLPELVRAISNGFEPAASKRAVTLELTASAGIPAIALDVAWIESALTNLIENALRFTKRGGSVRIRITDHGSEVSVAVSDDGPGIAPSDREKVFERFAQADSTPRTVGGTGIGLALVREAARLHGGSVELASELDQGATFSLRLPRRPLAENTEPTASERDSDRVVWPPIDEPPDDDLPSEVRGPSGDAPLALVVEDNAELRAFITDVLAVRYRVHALRTAPQALALIEQTKPDVVVTDLAMPGMNGYELCRRLRAQLDTQEIPILLVTARVEIGSVLEGFEAGASDYILKPFHGRELLARVDVHVRIRRLTRQLATRERHAALGVLAASVAHQVRNPLTSLVSGLPMLRARLEHAQASGNGELIDVMIDCAARIERTTRDLLDLSRIDRERSGQYRPSEGLQAAVRLVRARLPHAVGLDERIEASALAQGRAADMNHVFLNLLDNAIRAVSPAGRVTVRSFTEGSYYVVSVADSGPGIDADLARHVFEPFFTTRPAGQGTGLGLAIAEQVIQQCGGKIELGRAQLGGAEFKLYIPILESVQQGVTEAGESA